MLDDRILLVYEIPQLWSGRTIDSFLRQELRLSRSRVRDLKKRNGIYLDHQSVPAWQSLRGGERLVLEISPLVQHFEAEAIPLDIIYEDPDLVVVNKPAGMVVHPVKKYQSGTLANALIHHWAQSGEKVSFHPVHRLDRLTTGLVLIAKNPLAHQQLALQIQEGTLRRLYLALCTGVPFQNSGKIIASILDIPDSPRREVLEEGKNAMTRFRVIEHNSSASLLAVKLFTGRTHQIRAHLAHLGNPLWGDPLYGQPDPAFPRPALHAVRLSFFHPRTRKKIRLESVLPEDLVALLGEVLRT